MTTHQISLISTSRASDAGFMASADLDAIARKLAVDYRLIGGNAVTLLTHIHGVSDLVPARETADADFGALPEVIASSDLPAAWTEHGYRQVEGNRFVRSIDHAATPLELVVDVLAPSLQGQLVTNQKYGELHVDEVPGLLLALTREPEVVELEVRLSEGTRLKTRAVLPDPVSALALKAYAFKGRMAKRDALDIWRLLEAARASGATTSSWPTSATGRDTSHILHRYFGATAGPGVRSVSSDRGVQARVRAIVSAIVPTPPR